MSGHEMMRQVLLYQGSRPAGLRPGSTAVQCPAAGMISGYYEIHGVSLTGAFIMGTFIATLATLAVAVLTALVWKINKQMAWLAGAMESHSAMMLRMEAEQRGIELEWWDPSIEAFPREGGHGEPCRIGKIYIGIPPRWRKKQTGSVCYRLGLFVRDFRENVLNCWDDFLEGRRADPDAD